MVRLPSLPESRVTTVRRAGPILCGAALVGAAKARLVQLLVLVAVPVAVSEESVVYLGPEGEEGEEGLKQTRDSLLTVTSVKAEVAEVAVVG